MEAKSIQKYILTSPQKLREVVFMVKTLSPAEAVERLPFTHKKAADELSKVIKSAIANAKQMGANESELVFKDIEINEGPRLKRYRAGARGRAKPYKKRMSHIRVVVETKPVTKIEEPKAENSANDKSQISNEGKKEVTLRTKKKGTKETSA